MVSPYYGDVLEFYRNESSCKAVKIKDFSQTSMLCATVAASITLYQIINNLSLCINNFHGAPGFVFIIYIHCRTYTVFAALLCKRLFALNSIAAFMYNVHRDSHYMEQEKSCTHLL
jgi:hypothetical protein